MARIGIMVEFRIKPGHWETFDSRIRAHAQRTLDSEPGCQRFDVFQPLAEDGTPDHAKIMLCEVYDDMAAFDVHRAKPRHPDMADTASMLEGRVLTICELA